MKHENVIPAEAGIQGPKQRVAVAALLLVAFAAFAHEHPEQWTLANEYPATSLPGEGDAFFAKAVADATEGHLSIITMPDARMGYKSREQLKAVAEGKLAMADTIGAALAEDEPVFARSSLPFAPSDIAAARAAYERAKPRYEAAFARHNQKLLYVTPLPPPGPSIPLSFTTVNLDKWNGLDAPMRAEVLKAAAETEARQWKALQPPR